MMKKNSTNKEKSGKPKLLEFDHSLQREINKLINEDRMNYYIENSKEYLNTDVDYNRFLWLILPKEYKENNKKIIENVKAISKIEADIKDLQDVIKNNFEEFKSDKFKPEKKKIIEKSFKELEQYLSSSPEKSSLDTFSEETSLAETSSETSD